MTRRASHAFLSLVLLLGVCLATWSQAFGPAAAHAADTPAAPAWPVAVGITEVNPLVPQTVTDQFSLKGAVKNTGSRPLTVSVRLQVSKMKTRWDMSTATPSGYDGKWVGKAQPITSATLAPQSQSTWVVPPVSIKDLLAAYGQQPGVYAIDAVAVDGGGNVLGVKRTFLPWKPMTPGSSTSVSVALAWPLASTPALTGSTDASGLPLLADFGGLAEQLAPDGRLNQVVQLGKQLGAATNWIVDPDLFYSANLLKVGYAGVSETASTPASGQAAGDWLAAATAAIKGANCWALPYTDPDLATLAHSPQGLALLKTVTALGPAPTTPDCDQRDQILAWPGSGQSDQPTTAAIRQFLPDATALVTNTFYTDKNDKLPKTHVTLDGKVKALVSDTYLDGVFTPAPEDTLSDTGVLAGQLWLAQTAMMARENLANHSAIAAPPRTFQPTPALVKAMQTETNLPPDQRWMSFTTLEDLKKAPLTDTYKSPAKQSDAVAKTNIDAATVTKSSTTQSVYSAFLAILESKGNDRLVPFRMVATSWRGRPGPAGLYADALEKQVFKLHDSVYLAPVSPLTLSGKSGKIPVTIKNDLPVEVAVYIQAASELTNRLAVTAQPGKVFVPSGGTFTVQVPVRVVGSGQTVNLTATLHQPAADGQIGDAYYPPGAECPKTMCHEVRVGEVKASVKVSAIGIIALALMIGSAAVLVVAIGLRVVRANRAHHPVEHDTMAS